MKNRRHGGFTILEAIASVFVLTLILTATLGIIVNASRQTQATQAKLAAYQIGDLIRSDVESDATYVEVSAWQNGVERTLTSSTCSASPYGCLLFGYVNGSTTYDSIVEVTFFAPTTESEAFGIIHFQIRIEYYPSRFLELSGVLYDE